MNYIYIHIFCLKIRATVSSMHDIRARCFVFLFSPLFLFVCFTQHEHIPFYKHVSQSSANPYVSPTIQSQSIRPFDWMMQFCEFSMPSFLVPPIDTARVCYYDNPPWSRVMLYEHKLRYRHFKDRVKHALYKTLSFVRFWNSI